MGAPTVTKIDLSTLQWSTVDQPSAEQYGYWREALWTTYTPLLPMMRQTADDRWAGGLPGRIRERPFGDVRASQIQSCRQVHRHGRRELAHTEDEVVFVNLQIAGRCMGQQGDRQCVSEPGSFAVFDATREFRLDYLDDWTAISFRIPREQLLPLVPGLDRTTSVAFDGTRGMNAVVADLMRTLWRVGNDLGAEDGTVAGVLLPALGAALRVAGGQRSGVTDNDAALRAVIVQYAGNNLTNGAQLNPEAVATHFGISVRKLHQLFETTELTFSQTIMKLRVQECARDIGEGRPDRTLTRIAAKWGFSDLSHMNRVFRTTVGRMPASYR